MKMPGLIVKTVQTKKVVKLATLVIKPAVSNILRNFFWFFPIPMPPVLPPPYTALRSMKIVSLLLPVVNRVAKKGR